MNAIDVLANTLWCNFGTLSSLFCTNRQSVFCVNSLYPVANTFIHKKFKRQPSKREAKTVDKTPATNRLLEPKQSGTGAATPVQVHHFYRDDSLCES